MGRESTAWSTLRDRLNKADVHTERLTDRIQDGLPDVLWLHRATRLTGLIELKAVAAPLANGRLKVEFRPSQPVWLFRWRHLGGRGAVLTRVTNQRIWVFNPTQDDPAWVHAITQDLYSVEHYVFRDTEDALMLVHLLTTRT